MRLTTTQLRRIIREEASRALNEDAARDVEVGRVNKAANELLNAVSSGDDKAISAALSSALGVLQRSKSFFDGEAVRKR